VPIFADFLALYLIILYILHILHPAQAATQVRKGLLIGERQPLTARLELLRVGAFQGSHHAGGSHPARRWVKEWACILLVDITQKLPGKS
jgi:hypothetical protein